MNGKSREAAAPAAGWRVLRNARLCAGNFTAINGSVTRWSAMVRKFFTNLSPPGTLVFKRVPGGCHSFERSTKHARARSLLGGDCGGGIGVSFLFQDRFARITECR